MKLLFLIGVIYLTACSCESSPEEIRARDLKAKNEVANCQNLCNGKVKKLSVWECQCQ